MLQWLNRNSWLLQNNLRGGEMLFEMEKPQFSTSEVILQQYDNTCFIPGTTWYNHVFPCTMNSTIKSLVLTWDRHVFIYPYLYFHRPTGLWRYFTKIILWQFIVPQRKHCNLKKWLVSPTKKAYQLTTESCSRTNLRTLETEYWKWHLYR